MQIEITGKSVVATLGWVAAVLFWALLAVILIGLMTANSDSGSGEVISFTTALMGRTFPVLIVPIGILVYGIRKDRGSLLRVLFKWGTIAVMAYIPCFVITVALFH